MEPIPVINGKSVDTNTLVVEDADMQDYPDFVDAYFSEGFFLDGSPMTNEELDKLNEEYPDILLEKIMML